MKRLITNNIYYIFIELLRIIDEETATKMGLIPGQKLCRSCRTKYEQPLTDSFRDDDIDMTYLPPTQETANLDVLGISPLKSVSMRDRVGYGKRKLNEAYNASKDMISTSLNVSSNDISFNSSINNECCDKSSDLDRLCELIKEKLIISNRTEKLKLLTLTPASWTIQKTVEYFAVTKSMVETSHKLKKSKGILGEPDKKSGKKITVELKTIIENFYQSDEYSCMCPGKKEFVSVKIDGKKTHMQKRLLLINLKELYLQFSKLGHKIGFSKFCQLRPRWCVTVDSASGVHSVCVCQIHQNAKLLAAAVPGNIDYKEMLAKTVCDMENRDCMLHSCDNCPGVENFKEHALNTFTEKGFDLDDIVSFKQWMQKEKAVNLVTLELSCRMNVLFF